MDKKTNKKPTKAETESLLSEAQSNENVTQNQPQADTEAAATEAEQPKAPNEADIAEAQDDTEAKTRAADAKQPKEESQEQEAESTDTGEAEAQDVQETQAAASEEAHEAQEQSDVASNAQPIIYAGVVLVRNKTPKPLALSPIQLGIYATLTIQSGEIVALPHKYARSMIMQNCFEQVSGKLYFVQEE